jgi:hypothetical protein
VIKTLRFEFDDRDLEEIEQLKAEGFEFVVVAVRRPSDGFMRNFHIVDCTGSGDCDAKG